MARKGRYDIVIRKNNDITRLLRNNHTLSLVMFPVEGLDMNSYVEFRVEETDENGKWLGYLFFSSIEKHAIEFMERFEPGISMMETYFAVE